MHIEPTTLDTVPVIVFGLDERGKGHASRFEPTDATLAERAAALMGMRVLRLTTPDEQKLAVDLPAGRVFASGKAFVPFVARKRFDLIAAAPGSFTPDQPADDVVEAPDKPVGGRRKRGGADARGEPASAAERFGTPPADWAGSMVGSLVLAAEEGKPQVWYIAKILAQPADDLFELQWLDENDGPWPIIVRRREHIGLFPPALAGALG